MFSRKVILTLAVLVSFSLPGCRKLSAHDSYLKASKCLESVGSVYSTLSETARMDGETRSASLPVNDGHKSDPDNAVMGRFLFAYMVAFDAKRCGEAREMLANFAAQEELKEKPSAEAYDKLVGLLEELSKSADNLITNPKVIEGTPAVERVQLRKLPPLIKEAYDLVIAHRPPSGS